MLYWLLYQRLFAYFPPFRIFRYVTFRTAFASLTALFLGLVIGPAIIRQLREFQIGQYIREEGPSGHQKKAGTPTMGGVLIVIAIVVPTLLWADLSNPYIWLAIFATVAFGAVGLALVALTTKWHYLTNLMVPFFKQFRPDLVIESIRHAPHIWFFAFIPFVLFVMLVLVGSSNA